MQNEFWAIGLGDILQTLGSFLGVFLAVKVSVSISKKQIDHERDIYLKQILYDKNKEQIAMIENFLKTYYLIENAIKITSDTVEEISNHVNEASQAFVEGPVIQAHKSINQIVERFKFASNIFEKVNEDYIPLKIYNDYQVTKSLVSFYYPIVKLELDKQPNPADFYMDEIKGTTIALRDFSAKINEYKSNQEKKLTELQ